MMEESGNMPEGSGYLLYAGELWLYYGPSFKMYSYDDNEIVEGFVRSLFTQMGWI